MKVDELDKDDEIVQSELEVLRAEALRNPHQQSPSCVTNLILNKVLVFDVKLALGTDAIQPF